MLPDREIDLLTSSVLDAIELAVMGQTREGHERLLAGFQRAQGAHREGCPWAGALVRRYEEALRSYAARYDYTPPCETELVTALQLRVASLPPPRCRREARGERREARLLASSNA